MCSFLYSRALGGWTAMSARKRDLGWRRDLERLEDRQMLSLVLTATNIPAIQGQAFNGAVATLFDTDLTAVPSDFTARISWGNGQQQTAGQVVGTLIPGVFQVD